MTAFVGLTHYNALGQGGTNLQEEAENLRGQVLNLIADLEKDKDAVQGGTLAAFQAAKGQLLDRFDELIAFCRSHGIDLSDAQHQVVLTDTGGADEMTAAATSLAGPLAMSLS